MKMVRAGRNRDDLVSGAVGDLWPLTISLGFKPISGLRRSGFPDSLRTWITGVSGWRCFGYRTRHELAANFLSGVAPATALAFWL
jgi:hypothetical protein